MTDEPFDPQNVAVLSGMLKDEVAPRGDDYWAALEQRLSDIAVEAQATPVRAIPAPEGFGRTPAPDGGRSRRWAGVMIAAAAALLVVAGLLAFQGRLDRVDRVDTGLADSGVSDPTEADSPVDLSTLLTLPGPEQNVDHWNAVYGVWDCTADSGDGTGDWLAPFQSQRDGVGIHSHGDGLISIHPFFEESAGENATFSHFVDAMQISLTDDSLTLDDGRVLSEGADCNGEPAVLQLLRWQDARAFDTDPTVTPRRVTTDFGSERFFNDLEVWVLAFAPEGTDIPLPPRERFDTLAQWWWSPEGGVPADVREPRDETGLLPEADAVVSVALTAVGAEADQAVRDVQAARPDIPELDELGDLVPQSAVQRTATAPSVREQVELLTHVLINPESTIRCEDVVWSDLGSSGGCTAAQPGQIVVPHIDFDNAGDFDSIAIWDAPVDARWFVVELENGFRIAADVVEGASWAPWWTEQGDWASIELLDIDNNVVWSRDR